MISLSLVHYNVIQLRYFWWNYFLNNLSLLNGLLKLVCLCWWFIASYFISDDTCSSTTVFVLLHMQHQSITSFEHLFFFFRPFYLSTRFLLVFILESSVIYQLANLFPNFCSLLCSFFLFLSLVYLSLALVSPVKSYSLVHAWSP